MVPRHVLTHAVLGGGAQVVVPDRAGSLKQQFAGTDHLPRVGEKVQVVRGEGDVHPLRVGDQFPGEQAQA